MNKKDVSEKFIKSAEKGIIDHCKKIGLIIPQIAYILATINHETDGMMVPRYVGYWDSESSHDKWFSRGYVMIQGVKWYNKFANLIGKNIVDFPEMVMNADTALEIVISGMVHGHFTGHPLRAFVNGDCMNFVDARRSVVTVSVKAEWVSNLAWDYLQKLHEGYWDEVPVFS